jgi:hypothetical protein
MGNISTMVFKGLGNFSTLQHAKMNEISDRFYLITGILR